MHKNGNPAAIMILIRNRAFNMPNRSPSEWSGIIEETYFRIGKRNDQINENTAKYKAVKIAIWNRINNGG